ncbi:MAG: hypothetical protein ACK4MV_08625 [Beijerinckiaceae bacterium]
MMQSQFPAIGRTRELFGARTIIDDAIMARVKNCLSSVDRAIASYTRDELAALSLGRGCSPGEQTFQPICNHNHYAAYAKFLPEELILETTERLLSQEEIEILREAFNQLAKKQGAVTATHREAIAARLIAAARSGIRSVEELVAAAEAL